MAWREFAASARSGAVGTLLALAVLAGLPVMLRLAGLVTERPGDRWAAGVAAGVLSYGSLMAGGKAVAQALVDGALGERVGTTFAGLVLGVGAAGALRLAVLATAGAVAGLATGTLAVPVAEAAVAVCGLVGWYLLGFGLCSAVLAGVGTRVRRPAELAPAVAPVLLVVVAAGAAGVSVLPSDPQGPLAQGLSLLPVCAPVLMPMRLAIGAVPAWQLLLAAGLLLLSVAVALRPLRRARAQFGMSMP